MWIERSCLIWIWVDADPVPEWCSTLPLMCFGWAGWSDGEKENCSVLRQCRTCHLLPGLWHKATNQNRNPHTWAPSSLCHAGLARIAGCGYRVSFQSWCLSECWRPAVWGEWLWLVPLPEEMTDMALWRGFVPSPLCKWYSSRKAWNKGVLPTQSFVGPVLCFSKLFLLCYFASQTVARTQIMSSYKGSFRIMLWYKWWKLNISKESIYLNNKSYLPWSVLHKQSQDKTPRWFIIRGKLSILALVFAFNKIQIKVKY
jgi:hypothetical protein